MIYPPVMDEWATVRKILKGFSVARLGDGEFKLADGQGYSREPGSEALALELRRILKNPHPHCLPAIPTMDVNGPKGTNWRRHIDRYARLLSSRVNYYSAFITRPDSAPSINCREYAELCVSIWRGRRVAVVCEPGNKILKVTAPVAEHLWHIPCPSHEAYAQIERLWTEIYATRADVVLLSCGPTATCLANRFGGVMQAIDIGSAGGFLSRLMPDLVVPEP